MPRKMKPSGKPRARYIIPIDWDLVDRMIKAGCPGPEIASSCHLHPDTFYTRVLQEKGTSFTAYSLSIKPSGEANLRLQYYERALKGNTQLLISLGKERLGYGKNEVETSGANRDTVLSIAQKKADLEELGFTVEPRRDDRSAQEDKYPVLHQELRGEETAV